MRTKISRLCIVLVAFAGTAASAQVLTTLYSFGANRTDGNYPLAAVAFDQAGNLYGSAAIAGRQGRGTVYRLSPSASAGDPWVETTIRQFHGLDGDTPECRLIVSSDGTLFGTAMNGGTHNAGLVFQLLPPTGSTTDWEERIIYSFGAAPGDATHPNQGLLATSKGIYGVSYDGGAFNQGTVFQLKPPGVPEDAWAPTILHSFSGGADGAFPSSELSIDSQGNLYGTTILGGAGNSGIVYQISPQAGSEDTWKETVLHAFTGPDGSSPFGRLQIGMDRVIYGTSDGGGDFREGTVFQLTPPATSSGAWTEAVLYSFSGGRDGSNPDGGVILGLQGRLYGTTLHGGPHGSGTVFSLTPPSMANGAWTEKVLYGFFRKDGFGPESPLIMANGALWGTTTQGGEFRVGTVFMLIP